MLVAEAEEQLLQEQRVLIQVQEVQEVMEQRHLFQQVLQLMLAVVAAVKEIVVLMHLQVQVEQVVAEQDL
jgi:hypothetical protein